MGILENARGIYTVNNPMAYETIRNMKSKKTVEDFPVQTKLESAGEREQALFQAFKDSGAAISVSNPNHRFYYAIKDM